MLTWLIIGTIVGFIMGMTGAGGTVIAVPLFMLLWGADIHQATGLALFSLFLGSTMNSLAQRQLIRPQISILVSCFAYLSARGMAELKPLTPDWALRSFFIAVCVLSFYLIWFGGGPKREGRPRFNAGFWFKIPVLGLFVGAITTMTGLGGGLILVPLLISVAGLRPAEAVASSLFTIWLISIGAIWFQRDVLIEVFDPWLVLALGLGTIGSALLIRKFTQTWTAEKANLIRRGVLTVVLLISVFSLLASF